MMGKAQSGELSCMATGLIYKIGNFPDLLFASLVKTIDSERDILLKDCS